MVYSYVMPTAYRKPTFCPVRRLRDVPYLGVTVACMLASAISYVDLAHIP